MAGSGTTHLRSPDEALLRAEHLVVEFPVGRTGAKVHAVSDVSIDVRPGETLGLVGESGCGKSTTGRAMMQLPSPNGGHVRFGGKDLTELSGGDLRRTRPEMQMIFQDPISSLNPRRKVRDIVAEPLRIWASDTHPPAAAVRAARSLLIADAGVRLGFLVAWLLFLFVNSGFAGLTGIEVSVLPSVDDWLRQSGPLLLLSCFAFGGASLVVAGLVRDRAERARPALAAEAFVAVLAALWVFSGGGSGRVAMGIGAVLLVAALVATMAASSDFASMAELRTEHERIVRRTLEDVGIDPDAAMDRRPHEFSGGQCQRICIARALVLEPKLIICDEPVSALDVSVQAQILNLLEDLKVSHGLTLVFIAHDLAVVKNISDRVAVMYLGKLCEVAPPDALYDQPAHPYTAGLLNSIPLPDPTVRPGRDQALAGEIPSPVAPPSGCRFRTRCPRAEEVCARIEPQMEELRPGQFVACHFPLGAENADGIAATVAARTTPTGSATAGSATGTAVVDTSRRPGAPS